MQKPRSMRALEELGRVKLSKTFYLRDFLHSEVASFHGLANMPDDPDLAVEAGRNLCEKLLEPIQDTFGRIAIRSGYRSPAVNALGKERYGACGSNEWNYARHIWDRRDHLGSIGATACIAIPWFADRYRARGDWQRMAWWVHDHLPYSEMCFYPKLWAFNIGWRAQPIGEVFSWAHPKGLLIGRNICSLRRADYSDFPAVQQTF